MITLTLSAATTANLAQAVRHGCYDWTQKQNRRPVRVGDRWQTTLEWHFESAPEDPVETMGGFVNHDAIEAFGATIEDLDY